MAVFIVNYREKGSSLSFSKKFAAPYYAAAFNRVMIDHAKGRLHIPASAILKVEFLKEVEP